MAGPKPGPVGCERAREQSRVLDGREVEKVDGPLKFRKQSVRQCQDDGRLADPARADDRYETTLFQAGGEFANRMVAPHHQQGPARQTRDRPGFRSRLGRRPGHRAGKAVAPAMDIGNVADRGVPIIQLFSKGGNVNAQTALIDDQIPPCTSDKLTLADN